MTCREAILIMTVLGLVGVVHTNAYSDEKLEEAMRQEALLRDYSGLVAGCMDGQMLIWQDPHTKHDMRAKCEVVEVGRIK